MAPAPKRASLRPRRPLENHVVACPRPLFRPPDEGAVIRLLSTCPTTSGSFGRRLQWARPNRSLERPNRSLERIVFGTHSKLAEMHVVRRVEEATPNPPAPRQPEREFCRVYLGGRLRTMSWSCSAAKRARLRIAAAREESSYQSSGAPGDSNGDLRLSRATRRYRPNVPVGSIDPFARPSRSEERRVG